MEHALIYDLEIVKAIPQRNEPPMEGIMYCGGWGDHASMGISTLCAFDTKDERYRVFTNGNKQEFLDLAADRLLVSFNGIGFDDKVISACWQQPFAPASPRYDILAEMWLAAGLSTTFSPRTHGGFGLDATAGVNFRIHKTGNGADAPIWWQQGNFGAVIDYCLQDVRVTKILFDQILDQGTLISPKVPGQILTFRPPPFGKDASMT